MRFQVRNVTRLTTLGRSIELADTSSKRRRGLLGHTSLKEGEGIWILPSESVHTFFMKFAIDLIYIDRDKRIRKVVHGLQPWRLSACLSAHSVIEVPAGTARETNTGPGDQLEIVRADP